MREMGEALEALTRDQPLVLVLEDLHWSDPSTLDLVSWTARRNGFARLMLVGTFRPADTAVAGHPTGAVVGELVTRRQAVEVSLSRLREEAAKAMLLERGCRRAEPAAILARRTGGNPLFITCLLDAWESRRLLEGADCESLEKEVPDSVCDLIERQLARLPSEDRIALEGASVLRTEFAAAAAAQAAGLPEEQFEQSCHRLARLGAFLAFRGEETWPDGTITTRFSFLHDLYREALYRWLPAGRRARMHSQVAVRLESAWGERAGEQAAVLAHHFEQGGAGERAAYYLAQVASQALRRNAAREADLHLEAALRLAVQMPSGEPRDRLELDLLLRRSSARIAAWGWSDPGAEDCYLKALELCRKWSAAELSPALYGLATLYEMRGEYARCQQLLQERMSLGSNDADSHELMACSTYHQGAFTVALQHADRGAELYDPRRHLDVPMAAYGDNPAVSCQAWGALSLALLGEPEQALERIHRAVSLARAPDHRFSLPLALVQAAAVYQIIDEPQLALERAEEAIQAAEEQGFPHHQASALVLAGWAAARLGEPELGLSRLDQGLETYRATGARIDLPYFLTLRAQCAIDAGLPEEALRNLEEALSFSGEGRRLNVEAEILRLMGDLAKEESGPLYRRALETARLQGARCYEQRIARCL